MEWKGVGGFSLPLSLLASTILHDAHNACRMGRKHFHRGRPLQWILGVHPGFYRFQCRFIRGWRLIPFPLRLADTYLLLHVQETEKNTVNLVPLWISPELLAE